MEWIAAALGLSIVALVWGWRLGGSAFAQNLLATWLLGPGLLFDKCGRRAPADPAALSGSGKPRRGHGRDPRFRYSPVLGSIFNAFDQLNVEWWDQYWHDMRYELLDAQDAEPLAALVLLENVMLETSSGVSRVSENLGADELMNIGDTPLPTELLARWRVLLAGLNEHVPVPAALVRLETSVTEQEAMRIEVRAPDHSLTLSPSDLSLRDNFVTAGSYGAVVHASADRASRVVNELMVDLGMRPRDRW